MKSKLSRHLAIVMAARQKWGDKRIALEFDLPDGNYTLKSLTGKWTLDTSVSPPFAREKSVIYWQGRNLKDPLLALEIVVGLK